MITWWLPWVMQSYYLLLLSHNWTWNTKNRNYMFKKNVRKVDDVGPTSTQIHVGKWIFKKQLATFFYYYFISFHFRFSYIFIDFSCQRIKYSQRDEQIWNFFFHLLLLYSFWFEIAFIFICFEWVQGVSFIRVGGFKATGKVLRVIFIHYTGVVLSQWALSIFY